MSYCKGKTTHFRLTCVVQKTSSLLKFFIGYLINKEITEACIRIAVLITISKKNVFFTQKGKKYCYTTCSKTKLQLFKT